MRRALAEERRAFGFTTLQVEYTQLAEYGGDVLVEHDVTFDLFARSAAASAPSPPGGIGSAGIASKRAPCGVTAAWS